MDSQELKRRFGRKVKALRERAGLTQEELAEQIDRTVAAVSNIERGVHATRVEVAYHIALAVKAPLDELFNLSGAGVADRARRKELDLLLADLQEVDVKQLRAIRKMIAASIEMRKELGGKGGN